MFRSESFSWIGVVLVTAAVAAVNCAGAGSNAPDAQKLKASIRYTGFNVIIVNDDAQDWTDVRLTLNDNYRCPPISVSPGASERVRMTVCVTASGTAYDPLTTGLEKVSATARLSRDNRELTTAFTCGHSLDCTPAAPR